jgi:hypothetical protein
VHEPTIAILSSVALFTSLRFALMNKRIAHAKLGRWMFYLPSSGIKLMYAKGGRVHTRARSLPDEGRIADVGDNGRSGRYSMSDWRTALSQPIETRLAEIWVMHRRLADAGLGPRPGGLVVVPQLIVDFEKFGPTVGLELENVHRLVGREPASEAQLIDAGVLPDGARTALTQPINGYVCDLCSVIGAKPIEAEQEVAELALRIAERVKATNRQANNVVESPPRAAHDFRGLRHYIGRNVLTRSAPE